MWTNVSTAVMALVAVERPDGRIQIHVKPFEIRRELASHECCANSHVRIYVTFHIRKRTNDNNIHVENIYLFHTINSNN